MKNIDENGLKPRKEEKLTTRVSKTAEGKI
jgi:hypothetical protein